MTGWGWVLWGYATAAIVLVAYVWSLRSRTAAALKRLDKLE